LNEIEPYPDYSWLKETYFADPKQRWILKKGETLMEEGGHNDRLYLILKGTLSAYVRNPDGEQQKLFEAYQEMFAGVYSFFSRTYISLATVVAENDCELAYIDKDQKVRLRPNSKCLFDQFMPVVVANLARRQKNEKEIAFRQERMLKKLIQTEKLASLGQMAAGISHELNNAVTVMARNTEWLRERLSQFMERDYVDQLEVFQRGLKSGRRLSSRELRTQTREMVKRVGLKEDTARFAVEADLSLKSLIGSEKDVEETVRDSHYYWELGATFHDMTIAARLATSVVRSVKALAGQQASRISDVDVNQTVREALALMSSPLRKVRIELDLAPLPSLTVAPSELVQVWTNIISNAVESMSSGDSGDKQLEIQTRRRGAQITIKITDNGPGIPEQVLPKIFQPNFSTKEKGLEFGLGLGLTIVERTVSSYNGDITVRSRPGRTVFSVKLPI